jgi:hypothetical protein
VLYLDALACATGASGADARRLLERTQAVLGADRGHGIKPWQRSILLAFEAIACSALRLPVPASTTGNTLLTITATQVHALAARGLRDALAAARHPPAEGL